MRVMEKERILKEICRTAEANGNVPLGRQSFFNETGIRESDWKGKFWARWNDAVREAGFKPNQARKGFRGNVSNLRISFRYYASSDDSQSLLR